MYIDLRFWKIFAQKKKKKFHKQIHNQENLSIKTKPYIFQLKRHHIITKTKEKKEISINFLNFEKYT